MSPVRAGVVALSVLSGGLGQAAATDICEPLRERIEAQIAATGVLSFAVIVANADAPVAGKVVGTCAKGTRKLVYVRADSGVRAAAPTPMPAPAPAVASARNDRVITECRDGTVVQGLAPCKP